MATQTRNIKQLIMGWLSSNWGVALLLAVVTVAVLAPVLIFQTTTIFVNQDNVDQFYAWYQKIASSWHHGYLPLWNANVYSGWEFAAELQPGVLYPINWLWVALFGSVNGISEYALNWLVALHFWLAAFGAYLLLKQMTVAKWAAFLAGLTYAFSGVVASRSVAQTVIFFGLALIPFILCFFVKYHDSQRIRWLLACGALLGLLFVVGHIQPFFHALLVLVIFEVVYLFKKRTNWPKFRPMLIRSVRDFMIVGVSAILIMLPQLVVSGYYLTHAYRVQASGLIGPDEKIGYGEFAKPYNIDMHEFINLVDPVTYQMRDGNNMFIGLAPLAVILVVAFIGRKQLRQTELWHKYSAFVTSTLVFSAVAMLGYVTWFAVVLYELPLVYQIRQLGRYSILFGLALIIALAASLVVLAAIKLTKKQKVLLSAAGLFLLINGIYIFALRDFIFSVHFAFDLAVTGFALLAVALAVRWRKALIALAMLATLFVNTLWFLPSLHGESITPAKYSLPTSLVQTLEATSGKYRVDGGNLLPIGLGNVYNVQMTGGYSATIYEPYYELTNTMGLDLNFVRDILGVQLLAVSPAQNGDDVVYTDPAGKFSIVKRPSALPKIFTSTQAGSVNRADYAGVSVTTEEYTDLYQRYKVDLNTRQQLIFSELYYPGWVAVVDGHEMELTPYKIASKDMFKSLDMPAGEHVIELRYKPYGLF